MSESPAVSPVPLEPPDQLDDAISALRYIEARYGRLDGVGWDRVLPVEASPPPEPPDPTLPPEAEGQPWEYGWWAVGAPPEPKT